MRYLTFLPPPELKDLVKAFWILEHESEARNVMEYSLFAVGLPNLVFQYRGPRFLVTKNDRTERAPLSHYSGQCSRPTHMSTAGSFGLIGAYVYPSATSEVFNLEAKEVTDCDIDLNTLFGTLGDLLEERIFNTKNDQERVRILAHFLLERYNKRSHRPAVIKEVVKEVLRTRGQKSVQDLAVFSGYSIRQLERTFKQATGFSPKYFSRITRFQHTMKLFGANFDGNLGTLAYDGGYADQAHFIREFSEFSGMSPKVYFKELNEVASSFVQL